MRDFRSSVWIRTTAFFLAALMCAGYPGFRTLGGLGAVARADEDTNVAVAGIFGHPDASPSELQALQDALEDALEEVDGFSVVGSEEYAHSLWNRRESTLQSVFLSSAESALQEGRVLYDNAQFQTALIRLEKAEDSLNRGVEFLRDPQLLVEIHLYMGLANMALGDSEAAEAHFEEVARTDPARTLDPIRTPPKMLEAFEQAKLGVAEAGTAMLLATSGSTPEADVYVNGLHSGKTPAALELAPGHYHITVHHTDMGWDYVDETLDAGDDLAIEFLLQDRGIRPLGREKAESSRSRRIKAVFVALSESIDADLLVLAALDEGDNLTLQAYSPRSGVFSTEVTGTALLGGQPESSIVTELVDELLACTESGGNVRRDATSTKTMPLYIGRNPLLNEILVGPEPPERVVVVTSDTGGTGWTGGTDRKPAHKHPLFWILIGSAVAGGVLGGVAASQANRVETVYVDGDGTVTVHIYP